ncbi:DUF2637 domain-containing protein [Glycomyces tritici]|uniref:DUF2637 domain-containing protein n=1 Tax=Glycomyces tritici TaxID=2665176 RepID=A0ABT7YYN8_9ACTN|nr:DUF2637 domain-containing protein [Glycomyces tritici]MDN3241827.1 DUF2637 domain-containing protein [Glycomyces tritici]MDN3243704.1 DUF2637 domain-containing protein [Glycomyces tritici]
MKLEDGVQTVIMLSMGVAAGAVSFTHVHDATVAAGQPSWVGWVNAVTIELMVIALGLEVRRRRRNGGHKVKSVMAMMMFFIALSLGAQVLDAEPTVVGWLAASASALGFLTLVKVVLSRPAEAQPAESPVASFAEPDWRESAPVASSDPIDVPSLQAERSAVAAEPAQPDWANAFANLGNGDR